MEVVPELLSEGQLVEEKAEATVWREVVNEETADAVAAGRDGGESGRGVMSKTCTAPIRLQS